MIEIIPLQKSIKAKISVPGSKSISNRALLIAALAKGTSKIKNCLESDDTKYMKAALKKLGIQINRKNQYIEVKGRGGQLKTYKKEIFLGNAGTATRFLTAALSLGQKPYTLTGDSHMQTRPIKPLLDALNEAGIHTGDNKGCPPVLIKSGSFAGGKINIMGNMSSQYISALLMIGPYGQHDLQLKVKNELTSKPYIDITTKVMADFGVEVLNKNCKEFKVKSGRPYKAKKYTVEGDFSSASYFAAIAALTGSEITLENLNFKSAQGDKNFLKVIEKMGCKIKESRNNIKVTGPKKLKALGETDLNHIPDTALTAAILAAYAEGKTTIKNVANLRIKETDRIKALKNELTKLGIKVKSGKDSISIEGNPKKIHGAEIETYEDHRIAMCFACLGTVVKGIKIKNPACVNKSYPTFWRDLKKLGIKMTYAGGRENSGTQRISSHTERSKFSDKQINSDSYTKNIVLTGMRGSGKSRIGAKIAGKKQMRFIDLDKEIEKYAGKEISQIIAEKGWEYFRKLEKQAVKKASSKKNSVISTGGGVILDKENIRNLKKNGLIIFLRADIQKLAKRIKKNRNRPSLTGKAHHIEVEEIWQERKEKYLSSADIVYDANKQSKDSKLDIALKAEEIIKLLDNFQNE